MTVSPIFAKLVVHLGGEMPDQVLYNPHAIAIVKRVSLALAITRIRQLLHDAEVCKTATVVAKFGQPVAAVIPIDSVNKAQLVDIGTSVFRTEFHELSSQLLAGDVIYRVTYHRVARALLISARRAAQIMPIPTMDTETLESLNETFGSDCQPLRYNLPPIRQVIQKIKEAQAELPASASIVSKHQAIYLFTVQGEPAAVLLPLGIVSDVDAERISLSELRDHMGLYCDRCRLDDCTFMVTYKRSPRVVLTHPRHVAALQISEIVRGPQQNEDATKSNPRGNQPRKTSNALIHQVDSRIIACLRDVHAFVMRPGRADGVPDWIWRLFTRYHLGEDYQYASYSALEAIPLVSRVNGLITPRLPSFSSVIRFEIVGETNHGPLPPEVTAMIDAGQRRQATVAIDQIIAQR
ncbi:MAG: hypothetical protein ABH846_03990 [Patescibacteria group bacterium]